MSIISVPFAYELSYTPPRSKIEREAIVYDTAPVTVAEAEKGQTSVAVVAPLEGGYVDYLRFADALWEPIPAAGPAGMTPDRVYKDNPFIGRSSPLRVECKEKDAIQPVTSLQIKEISRSTREAGIADAQRRANDILVVDGMLYERCPGPVYSIVPPKGGRGAATLVSGSINDPHINLGAVFRADQREEAIEFAEALFGKSPKIACDAFIITDTTALPDDFVETASRTLADFVLGRATRTVEIGLLPNDYLEAFLDYEAAADPLSIELDTLRGYIEAVGASLADSKNKTLAAMAASCRLHLDYLQRAEPISRIAP